MSERPEGDRHGGAPENAAAEPEDAAPTPPVTGLADVDRVLAREAGVRELPIEQQAAAYGRLHDELEAVLAREPGGLPAAPSSAGSPVTEVSAEETPVEGIPGP